MRVVSFLAAALMGLASPSVAAAPPAGSIDPARLSEHVRILASDAFEGRAPATAGEEKTIRYIAEQFAAAGLEPGGPSGSWFQKVSLVRIEIPGPVTISVGGQGWSR